MASLSLAWSCCLLVCFLGIALLPIYSQPAKKKKNIAVCICGQLSRWQPHFLVDGLLAPNAEGYSFHLFFVLQMNPNSAESMHSSGHKVFHPSKYAYLSPAEIRRHLQVLYPNSTLDMQYPPPHSFAHFEHALNGSIYLFSQPQFKRNQKMITNIFNMYNHQVECAQRVQTLLALSPSTPDSPPLSFDALILTREDAFFFRPILLDELFPTLKPTGGCDMLFKNCLSYGGYNMRFYLFSLQAGLFFLSQRLVFFQTLRKHSIRVYNPEIFEKLQASEFNLTACPQDVRRVPVTAARHVSNDSYCFYDFELQNCYLAEDFAMINSSRCERVEDEVKWREEHTWQVVRLRELEGERG